MTSRVTFWTDEQRTGGPRRAPVLGGGGPEHPPRRAPTSRPGEKFIQSVRTGFAPLTPIKFCTCSEADTGNLAKPGK